MRGGSQKVPHLLLEMQHWLKTYLTLESHSLSLSSEQSESFHLKMWDSNFYVHFNKVLDKTINQLEVKILELSIPLLLVLFLSLFLASLGLPFQGKKWLALLTPKIKEAPFYQAYWINLIGSELLEEAEDRVGLHDGVGFKEVAHLGVMEMV
ncbi:unnamed protein product [Dovyalis caffra]|uniref:Uncharacterized protein n=1 Tax=Dovyalis caffra TaxID=77055 RepID=A0AAV1RRG4_9ROSI|nr:unnamed protein product [Dovyalis caffra]